MANKRDVIKDYNGNKNPPLILLFGASELEEHMFKEKRGIPVGLVVHIDILSA